MATFQVQVEDLTGSIGDTAAISSWLQDGCKAVVGFISKNRLEQVASNTNFTDSIDIESMKVLSVLRKDANNSNRYMPCRELKPSQMGRVHDSAYMEYASTSDPAYIIHNQVINTFPESSASNDSRVVSINTDITVLHGATNIDNFPDEVEYAVTLYAARQAIERKVSDANVDEDIEMAASYSNQYAIVDAQYKEALQLLGVEEIDERKLQKDAR